MMSRNGTGAEPVVEVEAVAVTENLLKRGWEVNGLTLADLRDLFGGAGFAEARMSASLLGYLGAVRIAEASYQAWDPSDLNSDLPN